MDAGWEPVAHAAGAWSAGVWIGAAPTRPICRSSNVMRATRSYARHRRVPIFASSSKNFRCSPTPQVAPGYIKTLSFPAADVAVIGLRLPLHLNFQFEAGQYVDFILSDGMRRSYSIANAPSAAGVMDLEFHVRHLPGGVFTDKLFGGMKLREKFQFEGPLGSFLLRDSSKPALFLASGTGYAPIRSILLKELANGNTRKMVLYWGGRSRKDLYLFEEAQDLARRYANFTFVPVLSEPLAQDEWTGATGFVHRAVMQDLKDLSAWQVYACGVPAMVDAARLDFVEQCGLPEHEMYADAFVSRADLARFDALEA